MAIVPTTAGPKSPVGERVDAERKSPADIARECFRHEVAEAARAFAKGGSTKGDALRSLRSMNKALSPPLSEDDLRKIWDDAQAQEGATAADQRARAPGPEREAPGSRGLQKVTSGETRPAVPAITAAELAAKVLVPPDFIIEGILPAGLTILAGKPKVGKSWFALGASVAVSCGGHMLGAWRYKVKAGSVLHLLSLANLIDALSPVK